eukprot:CAMPEP_0170904812 /NCGR_PEP_ID=MMETSP0734-20130129/50651_1 /TAXON_ID=186038 /ORGANISM="Fragilariopsis kerguelensis, Strain L26-C5" /LENGTH=62 /DNA_ID=CAMNT_0011300393 /DNA_START=2921 /DNA_END=3109 /DNA_ORIENTATION=-
MAINILFPTRGFVFVYVFGSVAIGCTIGSAVTGLATTKSGSFRTCADSNSVSTTLGILEIVT